MSGKGGVGKSSITALLAVGLSQEGFKVGILDADITGPSIPKMFGVKERPKVVNGGLSPVVTNTGIGIMSVNLLLEKEDDPVIWRGPIIAGAVRQFWSEVVWGNLDFLLVDLPPGTGDSPLTVLQSLPVQGVIIVSSPQDLAHMVVRKAVNMVKKMDLPILGIVENMSSLQCPHCKEIVEIFGHRSRTEDSFYEGMPMLGEVPIDPNLSRMCDEGVVEFYSNQLIGDLARKVLTSTKEI
ncbi:MAG: Mrp/NBP35 family ATP-binding protein [Syntrophomonadaceae bacterium]|nr:Mrp/NBP35 family ATP-binding protein [Syntrophomonadaceae bacterium]